MIISFLHSDLLLFKKPPLLLQSASALSPKLVNILKSFNCANVKRCNLSFMEQIHLNY